MNIALFGAAGTIGRRILQAALNREHHVAAIMRDPSHVAQQHENLRVTTGSDEAGRSRISTEFPVQRSG